jgi:hypothetical protein
MGKLNKFVLIAITVAISISFVFAPLTHAKKNVPEQLMRVNSLTFGHKGSKAFNGKDYDTEFNYRYYQWIFVKKNSWNCDLSQTNAKILFDQAIRDKGDWIITERIATEGLAGDVEPLYYIDIYFSEKPMKDQELNWDKYRGYYFSSSQGKNTWRHLMINQYYSQTIVNCQTNGGNAYMNGPYVPISKNDKVNPLYIFQSTPKYKLGKTLDGVDINDLLLPENAGEKMQPDFMWTLDDKLKLRLTYMKNVKEFEDPKYPKLSDYLKWHYVLRESDDKRTDGKVIDDSKNGINLGYQYTLPTKQFYKLEITLDDSDMPLVWNPRPDFSYIKKRTFFINADGKNKIGNTFSGGLCDADGVCVEQEYKYRCEDMSDTLDRVSCRMNEQFSGGVLNPSLLAVRKLVSSLAVPDPPKCGIDIPPISDRRFQAFNPSNVVADACVRTKTFRQSFPLATVAINFSAAIFWLWLIVRIFNKLTSHKDDDMIGEV